MEIKRPSVCRLQQVEIGSLFLLVHGSKGNAICLRATYDAPSDDDEDQRIVPIHWSGEPSSVGVPIYLSAFSGDAVVLENARLEINPISANAAGSLNAVYAREGKLFFPLNDNGRQRGLVDAATGAIDENPRGNFVAFDEWYVTIEDDWLNRELIFPVDSGKDQ